MVLKRILGSLLVAGVVLTLGSCATTHSSALISQKGSSPKVNVTLLSEQEISPKYGSTFASNPFIAPVGGLLTRQQASFLVFRISVDTGFPVDLALDSVNTIDKTGKSWGTLMSFFDFMDYAMNATPPSPVYSYNLKKSRISWNYLPSQNVHVKSGRHSYIFVVIGTLPRPEGLHSEVRVEIDGALNTFDFAIPSK